MSRENLPARMDTPSMAHQIVLAGLLSITWIGVPALAQTAGCIVGTAKNGDVVKIHSELFHGAHDALIRPAACPDGDIVLVYGDDASLGEARLPVKRDESFRQLERYSKEQLPSRLNEICSQCFRYRVTADFEGRLDLAPSAGWKRDPRTGKVIGIEGFGHPLPFSRYRLVLTAVSNVQAVERTPPATERH